RFIVGADLGSGRDADINSRTDMQDLSLKREDVGSIQNAVNLGWTPIVKIPNITGGSYAEPIALTNIQDKILFVYSNGSYNLYSRTSTDGINWSNPTEVTAADPGSYIALANFRDKAALVYSEINSNNLYHRTSTDGINWSNPTEIAAPFEPLYVALTNIQNKALLVYSNGANNLYSRTSTDGINWTEAALITNGQLYSIALANFQDKALLVYSNENTNLYSCTSTDGINWTNPTEIVSASEPFCAALTNFQDTAVLVYGDHDSHNLYSRTSTDGINWTDSVEILNTKNTSCVTVTTFQGRIILVNAVEYNYKIIDLYCSTYKNSAPINASLNFIINSSPANQFLVGAIVMWGGLSDNIPEGWLLCNGDTKLQSQYQDLFNVIQYNFGDQSVCPDGQFFVPDLRGRFIRGVDLGSGRDPNISSRTDMQDLSLAKVDVGSIQLSAATGETPINAALNFIINNSSTNQYPLGAIIIWGGTRYSIPEGWLLCGGNTTLSKVTYSDLYKVIQYNFGDQSVCPDGQFFVPDLRGRFIRGVDLGSGRDPNISSRTDMEDLSLPKSDVGSIQPSAATGETPINAALNFIIKY
ncbi:MAG: tail fiber protein, partial [Rickettsiaceae bacterium]|nr:tail fiber protein [Rickettsiaceae bacterium]